jgi:hypothetical protein
MSQGGYGGGGPGGGWGGAPPGGGGYGAPPGPAGYGQAPGGTVPGVLFRIAESVRDINRKTKE